MVNANVAPLDDEQLLAAVQRAFRELIINALEFVEETP